MELSKEELINTVMPGGGHLVILGAGASKALDQLSNGDRNGKHLPLMMELVGAAKLEGDLKSFGYNGQTDDFELLYSNLSKEITSKQLGALNTKIREYFSDIEIPDSLTNYDYLLAGLRTRDFVATFNWDPLLVQAYDRLNNAGLHNRLPQLLFMHGNVAIGYCSTHKVSGPLKYGCHQCGGSLTVTPLLYPVAEKDYISNEYIKAQWDGIQRYMKYARIVTIYGYSAPATDVAAIELLQNGWGKNMDRAFEQFELIIKPGTDEQKARASWDTFIHTHHYRVHDSFFKSYIHQTPRRTVEAWWAQNLEAKFIETNPYLSLKGVDELVEWLQPLLQAEDKAKKEK